MFSWLKMFFTFLANCSPITWLGSCNNYTYKAIACFKQIFKINQWCYLDIPSSKSPVLEMGIKWPLLGVLTFNPINIPILIQWFCWGQKSLLRKHTSNYHTFPKWQRVKVLKMVVILQAIILFVIESNYLCLAR